MHTTLTTRWMEPYSEFIDMDTATLKDPKVHNVRRASVMRGYYRDQRALDRLIEEYDDPVHYETFEPQLPEEYGHLIYGLSKLQPGRVSDEFFMTKGHYHTIAQTGEIYLCLTGEGYMLMKTRDGQARAESMVRGKLVYVPPYWAHRSVNVGHEPLTTLFVYPADAGHNYGDITAEGFPQRIVCRNGEVVVE